MLVKLPDELQKVRADMPVPFCEMSWFLNGLLLWRIGSEWEASVESFMGGSVGLLVL